MIVGQKEPKKEGLIWEEEGNITLMGDDERETPEGSWAREKR